MLGLAVGVAGLWLCVCYLGSGVQLCLGSLAVSAGSCGCDLWLAGSSVALTESKQSMSMMIIMNL